MKVRLFLIAAFIISLVIGSYYFTRIDTAVGENTTSASGFDSTTNATIGPVYLQDQTPGIPQTGHFNVFGAAIVEQMGVGTDTMRLKAEVFDIDDDTRIGVRGSNGKIGLTGIEMEDIGKRTWQVGVQGAKDNNALAVIDQTAGKRRLFINKSGAVTVPAKL